MRLATAVLALTLSSCASTPARAPAPSVKPATTEQVSRCTYLDDLIGTSSLYGVFASKGVDKARADLLVKAASLGATNVVWTTAAANYGGSSVQAKAYRCPQ